MGTKGCSDSRKQLNLMDGCPQQHTIRRAVIIIIAAVSVSALAAVIIIWFAGLTGLAAWAVVAGLLAALLASLIIGLLFGVTSSDRLWCSVLRQCSA
jgi:hypothetical protein